MTEEPDQRVTCTACQRFKAGRCHQPPDAREVLRLRDERGGTKPSPEVLARLRAIGARLARNVTDELSHD